MQQSENILVELENAEAVLNPMPKPLLSRSMEDLVDDQKKERRRAACRRWAATHKDYNRERARKYRNQNHEKVSQRERVYRDSNKEKRALQNKQWVARNRERRFAYMKEWYAANAVRTREKFRAWQNDHYEERLIYKRNWTAAHRESVGESRRKSYTKHGHKYRERARVRDLGRKEEKRAYSRKYHPEHYRKNRDRILAQTAAYAKCHPEVRRRGAENYKRNHPDRYKAHNRACQVQRKARMRGADVSDNRVNSVIKKWRLQKTFVCYYCGERFPIEKLHVDHVLAASKGGKHSVGNICCACGPCNIRKRDKPITAIVVNGQKFLM